MVPLADPPATHVNGVRQFHPSILANPFGTIGEFRRGVDRGRTGRIAWVSPTYRYSRNTGRAS